MRAPFSLKPAIGLTAFETNPAALTDDEARADIFNYIERFYNPRRWYSTLGQLSPVEFEKRCAS